jgi:hypothetical protein
MRRAEDNPDTRTASVHSAHAATPGTPTLDPT